MSEVITMDRDMLTEVMAQAMARANQQRFGLPSRAAGEQSNITNFTEYYNLPLPTGNEVIAYQDFINDANNIIDGALHSIQNTLDTVSTTANNAASGVSAADTKIKELVQANLDNEVGSLPQFKTDTNDRLGNLENDVAAFGLPVNDGLWTYNSGSIVDSFTLKVAPFGLFIGGFSIPDNAPKVTPLKLMRGYTTSTAENIAPYFTVIKHPGNFFNLPEINVAYAFRVMCNVTTNGAPVPSNNVFMSVLFNGVDTTINVAANESTKSSYFISAQVIGITKYPSA